jgi:hypothetical protein
LLYSKMGFRYRGILIRDCLSDINKLFYYMLVWDGEVCKYHSMVVKYLLPYDLEQASQFSYFSISRHLYTS